MVYSTMSSVDRTPNHGDVRSKEDQYSEEAAEDLHKGKDDSLVVSEGHINVGFIPDTDVTLLELDTEEVGRRGELADKAADAVEVEVLSKDPQVKITVKNVAVIGIGLKMVVTFCNCVLIAMATGYVTSLAVLFLGIIDEFGSSRTEASPILSVFTAIIFGGGGVIGPLMNRFNGGTLCMLGSVTASTGFIITSYSPSLYLLIFSVGILCGIGLAVPLILAFTTIGDIYDEKKELMVTVVSICPAVGALIFPYMTSILMDNYTWRGTTLIYAGVVLNLVPVGYINAIVKRRVDALHGARIKTNWKDLLDCSLFRKPLYLVVVYCVLFVNTLLPIVNIFFVDMMRGKGFDIDTGSLLLSVNGFANMAGRTLITFLTPFLKCARVGQWCVYLLLVSALLCLYILSNSYTLLLVISIMNGLFWGMAIVSYPAMLLELSGPKRYTSAMGYCNLIGGAGGLMCGPVAGLIKDMTGSYDILFFGAAGLGIVGSAMLGFMYVKIHCCNAGQKDDIPTFPDKFTYIEP